MFEIANMYELLMKLFLQIWFPHVFSYLSFLLRFYVVWLLLFQIKAKKGEETLGINTDRFCDLLNMGFSVRESRSLNYL